MVSVIARNYARALFELSREEGRIDAVGEDLPLVRDALASDSGVRGFLASRLLGRPAKKAMIRSVFAGSVQDLVLRLLLLLVDRGRTRLVPEVAEEFIRLAHHARGEREATAWSPFPLDAGEVKRISVALQARFGGRVELDVRGRPELIAGVVAESEGQEMEFTLQGQMKALRERLTARQPGE
jgi:F-type H+-transporting ATPase subunit delta